MNKIKLTLLALYGGLCTNPAVADIAPQLVTIDSSTFVATSDMALWVSVTTGKTSVCTCPTTRKRQPSHSGSWQGVVQYCIAFVPGAGESTV